MKITQTLREPFRYMDNHFKQEFPNDDACLASIAEKRYPGGITKCEKCGEDRKHHRVTHRTAYACDHCGNHIYPLVGSIFEKSTTSLRLWFYAMYLMVSTRCGISAKQLQRETGVTYKTAWRMVKQIRSLLSDLQLERPSIEMDGTHSGSDRRGEERASGKPSNRGGPAGDYSKNNRRVRIVEGRAHARAPAKQSTGSEFLSDWVKKIWDRTTGAVEDASSREHNRLRKPPLRDKRGMEMTGLLAVYVLKKYGPHLHTTEIIPHMWNEGWHGSGDKRRDYKTVFERLKNKPNEVQNLGAGIWELTEASSSSLTPTQRRRLARRAFLDRLHSRQNPYRPRLGRLDFNPVSR